jgi:hypothetical protein
MLPKEQLDRISQLSRKQRSSGLTPAEQTEQAELRQAYLQAFRIAFKAQLAAEGLERAEQPSGCSCGDPGCRSHHHHRHAPH